MDPSSLTAGVVGLLVSINTLSMRSDIHKMTSDLRDLCVVLRRLQEAHEIQALPETLSDALRDSIISLGVTLRDVQEFLHKSCSRRLRGTAWAFSGRKQCREICDHIDTQKQTIIVLLVQTQLYVHVFP
jgi:hypothetical protein